LATEMISVAEALSDGERLVDARLMLWLTYTESGQMTQAASEAEEIRRLGEELRQPAHRWLGVAPRALVALMEGEFELAERLIEHELAAGPPTTPARDNVSAATFHRFLLMTTMNRPADVEQEVRAAVDAFPWYPLHRAALCLLLLDLNREDEAHGIFGALARDDFSALYRDNEWLLGISITSEACARLADAAAAVILYEQLAPFAGRHAIGHAEGSVGAVDRYLGLLSAVIGRLDDADRHLTQAIAVNERMRARPWAAHSQRDLARVLRQRDAPGDRDRASELERRALAAARQLGMVALTERLSGHADEVTTADDAVPTRDPVNSSSAIFRPEGEYWTVGFGDDSFRLRDAKGVRYLARLLAEPGRELLALDLAREPGAASARRPAVERDLRAADLGDAGAQLDGEAKAAYKGRLRDLQAELTEAEAWNDAERADRAREEIDFLARELARAVGLGGRDRAAGSASERARLSVTRAIRLAMARIADNSPALGAHLEATIRTGTYCAYRPDPRVAVAWET
jgi:tetratricopeptide (TPR) repeat protein